MIIRKGCCVALVLSLTACFSKQHISSDAWFTEKRECTHFETIDIQGPFDVDLHTGSRSSSIMLKGRLIARPYLKAKVQFGRLILRCTKKCADYGRRLYVRIDTAQIRNINYLGQGHIVGRSLNAPVLNLSIKNPGTTHLGGHLGLWHVTLGGGGLTTLTQVRSRALFLRLKGRSKLKMRGEIRLASLHLDQGAWLSMYWVKANRLALRGRGKTVLEIAGAVNVLDVELWDDARFNGHYLQAKETFVKTHDHARAEMTTQLHQHTLATDASDISFYHVPRMQSNYMAVNGAVLDLEDWTPLDSEKNLFDPVGN